MDTSILDILPIAITHVMPVRNSSGEIIDYEWVAANERMEKSLLPDGGSIVGKRVFEFDPSYRGSEIAEATRRAIEDGEEQEFVTRDGRTAEHFGQAIKTRIIPYGPGCIVYSAEVTEIERQRDAAQRRFELVKTACDHAAECILLIDVQSKITYANHAAEMISGYAREELIGMPIERLLSSDDNAVDAQIAIQLLTGEIDKDTRDKTAIHKSGERLKVSVTFSIVPGKTHADTRFIALARDVTEEREIQAKLQDAYDKAEVATRLKSEFLANMSHEIRTPLNGVLGMSQVLANTGLSPQQSEYLGIIKDSGNNLMVLLNDILDLSKIEAGKLDVSPIEADLRHKLNRVYKIHQPLAAAKGLSLRYVVDPSVPARLSFDPVRVRQCLENLVSNAIKFTSEGQVIMAVKSEPSAAGRHKVTVHVSDTGIGVAPDKQIAIFEAFQQGDGSITRSHGGTGLGLAITRQLARLMGGDITMVSDIGRGSVFTLSFDAGVEQADLTSDIIRFNADGAGFPMESLSSVRTLVVDDNSINRQVASTLLKAYGVITDEAENGKVALSKLESAPYDIVLLDIHMPVMDGLQTIKAIRNSGQSWADLPVIALTADAMNGDREKYLSKGMTGYVSKPISENDLMSEIRRILSSGTHQKSA